MATKLTILWYAPTIKTCRNTIEEEEIGFILQHVHKQSIHRRIWMETPNGRNLIRRSPGATLNVKK